MNRDLLNLIEDLNQAKQSISQLQASISKINQLTPNEEDLDKLRQLADDKTHDQQLGDKLNYLLKSPHIKLAVKFKQLFNEQSLPFIKMLSLINLKLMRTDESIDYILDFEPSHDKITQDIKFDDETKLPKLLVIKDDKLFQKIFIDKSFVDPIIHLQNIVDVNTINNTKLILKGKSILNYLLIDIINDLYPNLYYQDVEIVINKLINIELLFKLSIIYNLTNNLKYYVSKSSTNDAKINLIGNLFLAYIGGLSLEYSMATLKLWIKSIYVTIFHDLLINPSLNSTNNAPNHTVDNELITMNPINIINRLYLNEFSFLFEHFTFETLQNDPFVVKMIFNNDNDNHDHNQMEKEKVNIGTSSESIEMAKLNCIKDFLNNKSLKRKFLSDYLAKSIELKDINRKSKSFKDLIKRETDYKANYQYTEIFNMVQCTINVDQIFLGNCISRDSDLATKRCEAMAFDNLQAIRNQE